MLERGFSNDTLSWLKPSLGTVDSLAPIDASPPDLRDEMCNGKRHRPASDDDDAAASNAPADGSGSALAFFATGAQTPVLKPSEVLATAPAASEPIPVYTGPARSGPGLIAAVAADSDAQAAEAAAHHGKKGHHGAKKPPEAGPEEADKGAKPKPVRHANAKPEAAVKPADKPASADKSEAKPAKPKTAAKPAAKPAPKPKSDANG